MNGSSSGSRDPPKSHDSAPSPEQLHGTTLSLLGRAQTGDNAAVEALCERFLPRLFRWATGRLPLRARGVIDTNDLVQDTLVKTLRQLGDFEPQNGEAFSAYLRKALLNRIRDEARKIAAQPKFFPLAGTEEDPSPSPLEETIGLDLGKQYEKAFNRLRQSDCAAIFLKVELGMKYEEVADALNKPSADAARMAVNRALIRLAREMSDDDPEAK